MKHGDRAIEPWDGARVRPQLVGSADEDGRPGKPAQRALCPASDQKVAADLERAVADAERRRGGLRDHLVQRDRVGVGIADRLEPACPTLRFEIHRRDGGSPGAGFAPEQPVVGQEERVRSQGERIDQPNLRRGWPDRTRDTGDDAEEQQGNGAPARGAANGHA